MDDSVFLDDKHISLDLFQPTIDDETPPQRPPGYQSIDIARLPSAVRRYVQNQGIEHYWQQARIDRLHWASASYPSNVILLIFDGQKAERIPTYRRVSHDRHTLFVFRKPTFEQRPTTGGAFAPKSTSQTAEAEPEGKVLAYDIPNAMDTIHTAKPIMLQLHQLGWDKRTFTFEEEPITGWFSVTNIAGSEGKKLNLIVKDDNDEQGRRILSQLTITLKRNQTRYAFEVADLKADEVFDNKTGDLRFSVKGLRFDGQFSGPATLIKPTQLTIAQIAEQLVSIEQARGYEQARYAAKQLDYDAICALVNHRNLDDNDPNLMPSRFMLLPGASDEQLKANDNLNAFPWPVHQDGPQYFSVAFLKQCLQLSGHLGSDEALPRWRSVDHEQDDTIDTSKLDLHPEDQQAEFDDTLKTAYDQYRQEHGVKKALRRYRPKEESQYTVQAGDTLHSIAEDQGYPYWTLLQEANKGRVETPDLLKEGSQLTLPKLHADELYQWLETQQERPRYWTQKGFFFPADYLSFSLTQTQEQTPLSGFLTGYQHEPHHVFYYLHALQSTRINLLLPAGPNLSLALSNQRLNTPQQPLSLVPYRPERSDQALESTDSDRPLPKGLTFEQNTTDTQEKTNKDA